MKINALLFIFICMFLGNITSATALTIEDTDHPTSFTVKILPWEKANKVLPRSQNLPTP